MVTVAVIIGIVAYVAVFCYIAPKIVKTLSETNGNGQGESIRFEESEEVKALNSKQNISFVYVVFIVFGFVALTFYNEEIHKVLLYAAGIILAILFIASIVLNMRVASKKEKLKKAGYEEMYRRVRERGENHENKQ